MGTLKRIGLLFGAMAAMFASKKGGLIPDVKAENEPSLGFQEPPQAKKSRKKVKKNKSAFKKRKMKIRMQKHSRRVNRKAA